MQKQSSKPRRKAKPTTPKAMQPKVLETIFTGPSLSRKSRLRLEQDFRKLFANIKRAERQLVQATLKGKEARAIFLSQLIAQSKLRLQEIAGKLEQPSIDPLQEHKPIPGWYKQETTAKPAKFKRKARRKASPVRSVDPLTYIPGRTASGRPTLIGSRLLPVSNHTAIAKKNKENQ